MHDLNVEAPIEVKKPKVKKEKRKLKVWYKPFNWIPPVFETVKDASGEVVKNKDGTEKMKLKSYGHFKLSCVPGTVLASGEGENQKQYQVQKTGALVRLDKKPSKRALHRAKAR